MATLQWLIGNINHLQVVTICAETASIVLGLQADNGDWAVWIAELAVTAWLIMKSTATWKRQSHSITAWGSGTVGTIMLSLLAAIITQDNMGCWMVMSGWICWIARLISQFARAWWFWLWTSEAEIYEVTARYKAMTVRFKCSDGKVRDFFLDTGVGEQVYTGLKLLRADLS